MIAHKNSGLFYLLSLEPLDLEKFFSGLLNFERSYVTCTWKSWIKTICCCFLEKLYVKLNIFDVLVCFAKMLSIDVYVAGLASPLLVIPSSCVVHWPVQWGGNALMRWIRMASQLSTWQHREGPPFAVSTSFRSVIHHFRSFNVY